ncbi:MAG: hypothetical protein JW832_01295, partial [Deltaproteobacteria bacterium]|nr:hypothetical protein [Deltaproteobacteria bacterium]
MSDSVLVLVCNAAYFPFAKKLFANALAAGNWKGDLLLITNDEHIKPFTLNNRNIEIKYVRPIEESDFSWSVYNPIVWNKLNIFEEDMKRWNHIVFLDCDITIQGDINKLSRVKKFCAVPYNAYRLNALFLNRESTIYKELLKNFDLNVVPLNSGVMAFPSSIINKNTLKDMVALYNKYKYIMYSDDEIINLFFYKKWKKLKITYSYDLEHYKDYLLKSKPPRIIHYVHDKTWQNVIDHGYGIPTIWQDNMYELLQIRV